jgi:hypothetical protein
MEQCIDECCDELVHVIRTQYLSTEIRYKRLDLGKITNAFTMDVLTALAFGKHFGYLTGKEEVGDYINAIEDSVLLFDL